MTTSDLAKQPLVSIVTPVYNGASHLDDCIQSVRRQTYSNWRYFIVNNCSTDATVEIASRHAAEDDRIRVVHNTRFLPLTENWNHALHAISPGSRYVKVLHADDLLFEECIEKMVSVAERHPSVGIVSAYVRKGTRVIGGAFPFPDEFRAGHDVGRETLQKRYYVFGSPSSTLLRADLVEKNSHFYNEDNFHADVEACFQLLRDNDMGFVHQVLTFTREHDSSQTATVAKRLKSNLLENQLGMLTRFGPDFLNDADLNRLTERAMIRYYREIARNLHRFLDPEFREYHRMMLSNLGLKLKVSRLLKALILRVMANLTSPGVLIHKLFRRAGHQSPR